MISLTNPKESSSSDANSLYSLPAKHKDEFNGPSHGIDIVITYNATNAVRNVNCFIGKSTDLSFCGLINVLNQTNMPPDCCTHNATDLLSTSTCFICFIILSMVLMISVAKLWHHKLQTIIKSLHSSRLRMQ